MSDTVALQIGQGVTPLQNPFDLAGQALKLQQGMNANRLFQSQVAAGNAFQNSIDPNGTPNQNRLLQNLKASPDAAASALATADTGQQLSQRSYEQMVQHLTLTSSAMAQLLAQKDISPQDVTKRVSDAVSQGYATADEGKGLLATMPADPAKIRPWIISHQIQNLTAQQALTAALPAPAQQNMGATTRTIDVNPVTNPDGAGAVGSSAPLTMPPQFLNLGDRTVPTAGGAPTGPGFSMALSPAEATTPTQVGVDAQGAPLTGTRQQFIDKTGAAPVKTGLGAGETSALTAAGTASAEAGKAITDAGVAAQTQRPLLQNMVGDASLFTTGPGADKIKAFQQAMLRYTPALAASFGIDPKSVAANESFDKLAAQIANAQGASSDARYAGVSAANPSSHLSPGGVQMIIHQLIGNADANDIKARVYANWVKQNGEGDRRGFEATFAPNFDPRVFQYNRMSPGEKTTMFNSITNQKDRDTFKSAYRTADTNGWLKAVTGGQ